MNGSEIRIQRHDAFPTSIIEFDYSNVFTSEDQELMTKDIDFLIDNGEYQTQEGSPLYQTKTCLFYDDRQEIWLKLKETFLVSCKNYLMMVENFSKQQEALVPIHTLAWGYKSWKSCNEKVKNPRPEHNHNPAYLAGVFYLKIPKSDCARGTEFIDPRDAFSSSQRNVYTDPVEFSWCIFPGWLTHKACLIDTEEPRYTVAANVYCAPL